MEWCLDCHRQPEKYVRPRDQVYNMTWSYADLKDETGQQKFASQTELGHNSSKNTRSSRRSPVTPAIARRADAVHGGPPVPRGRGAALSLANRAGVSPRRTTFPRAG